MSFLPLFLNSSDLSTRTTMGLVKYEPRIAVRSVNATPNNASNGYDVAITYEILGRDDGRIVADVFLERTR